MITMQTKRAINRKDITNYDRTKQRIYIQTDY